MAERRPDPDPEPPRLSAGWVDRRIQEAYARGAFDDLPGAGKPLRIRDAGDPDWFAKRLVEREGITGVLPGPLALRRERRELPALLDTLRTEEQVREVLVDFNRRVREALLRPQTGPSGQQLVVGGVSVEEYVEGWRQRRLSGPGGTSGR